MNVRVQNKSTDLEKMLKGYFLGGYSAKNTLFVITDYRNEPGKTPLHKSDLPDRRHREWHQVNDKNKTKSRTTSMKAIISTKNLEIRIIMPIFAGLLQKVVTQTIKI